MSREGDAVADVPDDQDLAKSLLAVCQDHPKEAFNRAFQSVGALLLIVGWTVGSDAAQRLLRRNEAALAASLLLVLGATAYALAAHSHLLLVQKARSYLGVGDRHVRE